MTTSFDPRFLIDVAILPSGEVVAARRVSQHDSVAVELHVEGRVATVFTSRTTEREVRLHPDPSGAVVWMVVAANRLSPAPVYLLDRATQTVREVHADAQILSPSIPLARVASTRGLFVSFEDGTVQLLRPDGSAIALGEGRVSHASASRFVRARCTTPVGHDCRLTLEDLDDAAFVRPLATDYESIDVRDSIRLPLPGAPLPAVTRDGRSAFLIGARSGKSQVIRVDLVTGAERAVFDLADPTWRPAFGRTGDYIALIRTPGSLAAQVEVRLVELKTGGEQPVKFEVPTGSWIITAG